MSPQDQGSYSLIAYLSYTHYSIITSLNHNRFLLGALNSSSKLEYTKYTLDPVEVQ